MQEGPGSVDTSKVRVAILGGGIAALAAAFELSHPRQNGLYQVCLYQLGWRLGGKCASGRDLDTSLRVKEHGPHILFGFYDNAFSLLQECYQELNRPAGHPFRKFQDTLVARNDVCLMEEINGQWSPWVMNLPTKPGSPGVGSPPTDWQIMIRSLQWLTADLKRGVVLVADAPAASAPASQITVDSGTLVDAENMELAALSTQQALELAETMDPDGHGHTDSQYEQIRQNLTTAQQLVAKVSQRILTPSDDLRHLFILANLSTTTMIGALADHLLFPTKQDLANANKTEYRAWLQKYCAAADTINSAVVRAMYDTVFAYPNGDTSAPGNVEAGSAVRAQLALIGYRGPPYWKMRAGTGDVTAAPLFEVLKCRGVQFHFFHRVDALTPTADGTAIDTVSLGRQVTLLQQPYDPLIQCQGLEVWPDRPRYEQIVEGAQLKANCIDLEDYWTPWKDTGGQLDLQRGRDFDEIVLGIPVGALGGICAPLACLKPAWRDMLNNLETVQTQCVQLWFGKKSKSAMPPDAVATSYDDMPIDTWLDASDVIPWENWSGTAPQEMAILCGPMGGPPTLPPRTDHGFPTRMKAAVGSAGLTFLQQPADVLWPNFFQNGQFDWSVLVAPGNAAGPDRYKKQSWGAGINPSDRYVLTKVDTSRYRLAPGQSGFNNLFLAGDWTDYGFNLGCFEGAVMSGRQAADAFVSANAARSSGQATRPKGAFATAGSGGTNQPLPPFVEYVSVQTLPGPIDFRNVTMWAFLLIGDLSQLTQLCQSFFDQPTGGRVKFAPLTPWVIMNFANFAEGRFVGNEQRGYSSERELAFAIPGTYSCSDAGGRIVETGFATFMPYLVVDNPLALITGREEYGFFKMFGQVGLPDDPQQNPFTVDVFGCKQFAPDAKWGPTQLAALSRGGAGPAARQIPHDIRKAAAQVLEAMFAATAAGGQVAPERTSHFCDLLTGKMTQIFLKQFRDIQDGRRACYQAVALADYQVTSLNSVWPEGSYALTLSDLDSAPIARDFGLGNVTSTGIGMKINLDMRLQTGRVLWQA